MKTTPLLFFTLAGILLACSSGNGGSGSSTTTSSGGDGGAGTGPGGTGGGSSSSSGSGGMHEASAFPDIATLQQIAVSPTCSRNQGVCHSQKDYPELGTAKDLVALVGMPCQLGAQSPSSVLDACEVPGDRIVLGGVDYEILLAQVDNLAPFPPKAVTLKLASKPASLDATGAKIHRLDAGNAEVLSMSLAGVTISAGMDGQHIVLALGAAMDKTLADFLDPRSSHGEHLRMGDPNDNGHAHDAAMPWGEIVPGDPARSFFYKRLLDDKYGPAMPLIPRAWSPAATRAVWCWIRGMDPAATPKTLSQYDPIDYDNCPTDPDAPDPNATGGWPSVRALFGNKCATSACHGAVVHSAGLDLTPDAATFQKGVIGVSSSQIPGTLRVVPGQPAASYLMCKVDPKCPSRAMNTALMPLNGTPLTDDELKIISDWIVNGAPVE